MFPGAAQSPNNSVHAPYSQLPVTPLGSPQEMGTHSSNTRRKVIYILLYYLLAVTVAMFNKHVIGSIGFTFPLLLSASSSFLQVILAAGCLWWLGCLERTARKLTPRQYVTAIVPCAVASGLDIGISNSSLRFVTLSFYTMVKSSAPIFVLACALLLGLEKPSTSLFTIMGVIAGGTLMTVWSDTGASGFDAVGFMMVLSAAVLSGVRWSLTQLIIEEHSGIGRSNGRRLASAGPLATILYLAPIAAILLLFMSALVEGARSFLVYLSKNFLYTTSIFTISGTLTFLLILTEYKVVQETSVLTFAITGILKEIVVIALSIAVFGDRLFWINYMGIIISIGGIFAYNWLRTKQKRERQSNDTKILVVPPAEPLQSFIDPDVNELLFRENEVPYIANLMGDTDMERTSTISKVKNRISVYLQPFAPRSLECLAASTEGGLNQNTQ